MGLFNWLLGKRPSAPPAIESPTRSYPREWLEKVPAQVFACLRPGELKILLHPGNGFVNGGAPHDVPAALVPPDLWVPNTPLWVQLDE
jgi:hypothetical protein